MINAKAEKTAATTKLAELEASSKTSIPRNSAR